MTQLLPAGLEFDLVKQKPKLWELTSMDSVRMGLQMLLHQAYA